MLIAGFSERSDDLFLQGRNQKNCAPLIIEPNSSMRHKTRIILIKIRRRSRRAHVSVLRPQEFRSPTIHTSGITESG